MSEKYMGNLKLHQKKNLLKNNKNMLKSIKGKLKVYNKTNLNVSNVKRK